MFLLTPIYRFFQNLFVFTWDFGLTLLNLVLPRREIGHVTPVGKPGAGGVWPPYVPSQEGDSRCSCPALNAMANHGILPHDGKNIKFSELNHTIRSTYNFAPTFCFFVPNFAANMLHRSYSKDTFDLKDLDLHNGIEHDGSLTREDSAFAPDQSKPHLPFIRELLGSASGKDQEGNPLLTKKDLSDYLAKRRVDSRASNPNFTTSRFHKMFGSSNSSTLLTIFGGRVKDIDTILVEERIPDGWESRILKPYGLTVASFNAVVLPVEFGVDEKKYQAKLAAENREAEATTGRDVEATGSD